MVPAPEDVQERAGRYLLFDELASGGMAVVHLGRLMGSAGFVRTVAIKRLHATFARDPDFVAMFTDEARLAARIRHPNVAATLDVVSANRELFLVMEYIHGESLSRLLRSASKHGEEIPLEIAVAIAAGILHGLHAAHEATTEKGEPLGVVHRDVSPQNVMVGEDGVARVVDFGVAKAVGRLQTTRDGEVKGKTAYMAPEQLRGRPVDRRADVYAAAVVLWETLTGHRLFVGDSSGEVVLQVLSAEIDPPSHYRKDVPAVLDALVLRGLAREPEGRFASALDFAGALERALSPASPREVGEWVQRVASAILAQRAAQIAVIERRDLSGLRVDTLPTAIQPVRAFVASSSGPLPAAVAPEVTSQVSSISVATPMPQAVPRKRPRGGGAARFTLAALAGAVVTALLGVAWRRPLANPVTSSAPAASVVKVSAQPAPPAETTPAPLPTPPLVTAVASTIPLVAPPAPLAPGAPLRQAATKSKGAAAIKPAGQTPPKAPVTPRCDPPYTVDADGIHIPKAECE